LDPLPDLGGSLLVGVDDEVFQDRFRDQTLDFAPEGVLRHPAVARRGTKKSDKPALFGYGRKNVSLAVKGKLKRLGVAVPAQLFDEELPEFELLQTCLGTSDIERHGLATLPIRRETERTDDLRLLGTFFVGDVAQATFLPQR